MPLYPTSFFIPASAAIPFLVEDKYIRGGYHCVADIAERDALSMGARKAGMRVFVADTAELYTLNNGDMTSWVLVPTGASRTTHSFTASSALANGAQEDFDVATGKTAFILKLEVSHVDVKVEAHSTPARNDTNPYTFVSYTGHLVDDGSSVLEDETVQFNRRYAIVSNLEATIGTNSYWRVINEGTASITPTIDLVYLPLEA